MNTQAHTSGPWGVSRHATPESFPQFGVYAESVNGRDLAHVVSHGTATSAETESNARLIAAAPEMLEALRGLLDQLEAAGIYIPGEDSGQWHGAEGLSFRKASEAIAKAEGRAGE